MSATFWSLFQQLQAKQSMCEAKDDVIELASAAASLLGEPAADAATLFLAVLSKKDKLAALGKTVRDVILKQCPGDCSGRYEQMWELYGTLCLTAFFDELDVELPERIREFIQLNQGEKRRIYQNGLSTIGPEALERGIPTLTFLHGFAKQEDDLRNLYAEMASRLLDFVRGLAVMDTALEMDILMLKSVAHNLPKGAIKRFRDQQLILCSNFNEFYIFTQQEWQKGQEMHWEQQYQGVLSLAMNARNSSQAGMESLRQAIIELPGRVKRKSVQRIAEALTRKYQRMIERPLIETTGREDGLTYPRISQAFIPQAYKVREYSGTERLGSPETWDEVALRRDMMSFWPQYLLDPGSTDRLLLVLGEPGSGKSLLTKIICARLISPKSIFLRIPLREHDMDEGIEKIVCRQLKKDGAAEREIESFIWFAQEFPDSPLTLLFDGYDEVLRATGSVYRSLLQKIREFQKSCREDLRRPVRVIVTSRPVLIDKADIPEETIVMKLQEFDDSQKAQWIEIWNRHNHAALLEGKVNDFSLPEGSREIEELSKQPLLLMMLAIYDADLHQHTNALKQKILGAEGLDRTGLYDGLVRRFVRRELREKGANQAASFEELDPQGQIEAEDDEMMRLGIAALGMLGRGRLFIQADELDADLLYMKAGRSTPAPSKHIALKDAEILFSSFFFIHKSQVAYAGGKPAAAFEFLHKTFYEFLVSDLILRCLTDAVCDLSERKSKLPHGGEALYELTAFPEAYHAMLSGVCLYAEPEIISMMAEWANRRIARRFQGNSAGFEQLMDEILAHQIALLQEEGGLTLPNENPDWFASGRSHLQVCATYVMNLLVLQVLARGKLKLALEDWRFLAQYVRLYLTPLRRGAPKAASAEDLILKFMAQFQVRREGTGVVLQRRTQIREFRQDRRLENHILLADFMLDGVAGKFYRLHSTDVPARLQQQYRQELYEQSFGDLRLEMSTAGLQETSLLSNLQHFPVELVEREVQYLRAADEDAADVLGWMAHLYQLACKTAPSAQSGFSPYTDQARHEQHHRVIQGYSAWSILGQVVFTKYLDQAELVRLYIALLGKVGGQAILLQPGYMNDAASRQPSVLPELVDAVLSVASAGFYSNEQYPVVANAAECLASRLEASARETTALLRYLYQSEQLLVSAPVWDEIERRWPSYLQESPNELSSLLQVYLEAGKFEPVRRFFQRIEGKTLYNLFYTCPEGFDSLLHIMQIVGEDAGLCEDFGRRMKKEPELTRRCPQVYFRLVAHAAARDCTAQLDRAFWIRFFLQQYGQNFDVDPVEEVQLLIRVSSQGFPEYVRIVEACLYSLTHFQAVLERSVSTAVQLLGMFARIGKDGQQIAAVSDGTRKSYADIAERFATYIKRCLRHALLTQDKDGAAPLAELLDDIGTDTKQELVGYLQMQFHYIRAYSEKLAEAVENICQASRTVV